MSLRRTAVAALAVVILLASNVSVALADEKDCWYYSTECVLTDSVCNACGIGYNPDLVTEECVDWFICSDGSMEKGDPYELTYCGYDASCDHNK